MNRQSPELSMGSSTLTVPTLRRGLSCRSVQQNQEITPGWLSQWAPRPFINDEWLPQQQPRPIFHLLASSSNSAENQVEKEGASASPLHGGKTHRALSVGPTWPR